MSSPLVARLFERRFPSKLAMVVRRRLRTFNEASKNVAIHGPVVGVKIRSVRAAGGGESRAADRFEPEEFEVDLEGIALQWAAHDIELGVQIDPAPHQAWTAAILGLCQEESFHRWNRKRAADGEKIAHQIIRHPRNRSRSGEE